MNRVCDDRIQQFQQKMVNTGAIGCFRKLSVPLFRFDQRKKKTSIEKWFVTYPSPPVNWLDQSKHFRMQRNITITITWFIYKNPMKSKDFILWCIDARPKWFLSSTARLGLMMCAHFAEMMKLWGSSFFFRCVVRIHISLLFPVENMCLCVCVSMSICSCTTSNNMKRNSTAHSHTHYTRTLFKSNKIYSTYYFICPFRMDVGPFVRHAITFDF